MPRTTPGSGALLRPYFNSDYGIEKIDVDTFDAKNKFFSARRSKSLNHADYGRNISIIMLN